MNLEEISEAQKWDEYHAAMAKEREYIALSEEKTRQRDRTWKLIRWAIVFWLFFVICVFVSQSPFWGNLGRLIESLGRTGQT
jgi:hypothetical protein